MPGLMPKRSGQMSKHTELSDAFLEELKVLLIKYGASIGSSYRQYGDWGVTSYLTVDVACCKERKFYSLDHDFPFREAMSDGC